MRNTILFMIVWLVVIGNESVAAAATHADTEAAERFFTAVRIPGTIQELQESLIETDVRRNRSMAQYKGVIKAFYSKHINFDAMKDDLVRIYSDAFDEEELNQLSDFFSSSAGQKYLSRQLGLHEKIVQIAQDKIKSNSGELSRMLDAETERLDASGKGFWRKKSDYRAQAAHLAQGWQSKMEKEIQAVVDQARSMAMSMVQIKSSESPSREAADRMIKEALAAHSEYLAIWVYMEPNQLDNMDGKYQNATGHDPSGRYMPYWNRLNEGIEVAPLNQFDEFDVGGILHRMKRTNREYVSDPMVYELKCEKKRKMVLAVPVQFEGTIIGAVGIEFFLIDLFKPIITQMHSPNYWAYSFLLNNKGVFLAHPTKWANVGRSLQDFGFKASVIEAVQEGRKESQLKVSKVTGRKAYYLFVPIQVGKTNTSWSLAINMPAK